MIAEGSRVRVQDRAHPGHHRVPGYLKGREGVVTLCLGHFPNPEALAYFRSGDLPLALYQVRFRQADLWPGYAGGPGDTLDADIYEHWLDVLEEGR